MVSLSDPGAFVREKRRQGSGWIGIARMLGRPVDSVRQDFDPTYQRVHTPHQPVCGKPSRRRIEQLCREAYQLEASDVTVVGVLWAARDPLTLQTVAIRAGVWIGNGGHDATALSGRRFLKRMAIAGIEVLTDDQPGRGWRLSDAARERFIQIAETVRG